MAVILEEVRFLKQTTLSNCGPTALLNALKWAGVSVGRKDYKSLYKLTKTMRDGTTDKDLLSAFKSFNLWEVKGRKPELKAIQKALKDESIVVLGYPALEKTKQGINLSGHYILILENEDSSFLVLNFIRPKDFNKINKATKARYIKTSTWITAKELAEILKPIKFDGEVNKPVTWAISLK